MTKNFYGSNVRDFDVLFFYELSQCINVIRNMYLLVS